MRFRYGTAGADPETTLVVDGAEHGFTRNLSHWPGNTTPTALKHDLSTGIALNWSALTESERLALFGPIEVVSNTHYDTDGVLSVLAVMRPDIALPRREAMLAAAATGDFGVFCGEVALATEMALSALPEHPRSPALTGLAQDAAPDARHEACYRWALDHGELLLDRPFALGELFGERHARTLLDVARVTARDGVDVRLHDEHDLAVITTPHELAAVALHQAAGEHYRLLLVQPTRDGHRYRFCYRDESWFELVSIQPASRVALDAAVAELQAREERVADPGPHRWWSGEIAAPVTELAFGDPDQDRPGFFLDPLPTPDPVSRLAPGEVLDVLLATLGSA